MMKASLVLMSSIIIVHLSSPISAYCFFRPPKLFHWLHRNRSFVIFQMEKVEEARSLEEQLVMEEGGDEISLP
ncbi:unnamed protein product [Linum trigynum]|uniref:Uncharacterized protein n=1 Tax=Linum trigynum TaxID=586398 RepID=A0AAV2CGF6_9ROSI